MRDIIIKIEPDGAGIFPPKLNPWISEKYPVNNDEIEIIVYAANGHVFSGWSGDVGNSDTNGIPLRVKDTGEKRTVTAHFSPARTNKSKLIVRSDFDNGNAILRYIDQVGRIVIIEPKQINDCTNIWWHFTLEGIEPGEAIIIDTNHSPIAGDCQPVYSYDGVHWSRFSSQKPPYTQIFTQSKVEIARNIPYPYSRVISLSNDPASNKICHIFSLCKSESDLDVWAFRITDPEINDEDKKILWVQARSHAFESHSSWVAEGFLRWVCGDSEPAAQLRKTFQIFVIPVLDVDNVYRGGAGKSQWNSRHQPADLNRDWGKAPLWNVTQCITQKLRTLNASHEFLGFLDLHSPWFYQGPEFYINKMDPDLGKSFFTLFSEYVRTDGNPNTWNSCWFVTESEDQLMSQGVGFFGSDDNPLPIFRYKLEEPAEFVASTGWVVNEKIIDPKKSLSITVEIPHWKDDSGVLITKEGLLGFGACLGMATKAFMDLPIRQNAKQE